MNKPHTVSTFELTQWLADDEQAFAVYASSSAEPKSLEVTVGRAVFRVTHGKYVVYFGTQPHAAVEAYNAIKPEL